MSHLRALTFLGLLSGLLPPSTSLAARQVRVTNVSELEEAVNSASAGDEIVIADGDYLLSSDGQGINCAAKGSETAPIVLRAENPLGAHLYCDTVECIYVSGAYWTVKDLLIEGTCQDDTKCEHALHVVGGADHFTMRGNQIVDFNAQLKVNADEDHNLPDHGLVEFNDVHDTRPRQTSNPTTKLNIDNASHWVVRGNLIYDFHRDNPNDDVSYGAFHKGGSNGPMFEQNLVICSLHDTSGGTRIGLSFGGGGMGAGMCPPWDGSDCNPETLDGVMRNNIIVNCSDVGIYLNEAQNTLLLHNTLIETAGIDFRFNTSTGEAHGNIVGSGIIRGRNGGTFTGDDNLTAVALERFEKWYVDPLQGDLRIKGDVADLVDKGAVTSGVTDDYCGRSRTDGHYDWGALEHSLGTCATMPPPSTVFTPGGGGSGGGSSGIGSSGGGCGTTGGTSGLLLGLVLVASLTAGRRTRGKSRSPSKNRPVALLALMAALSAFPAQAAAEVITTLTLIGTESGQNVPLTFGLPFKATVLSSSESVVVRAGTQVLPTQFDIKTTYDDKSIKFGIISCIIPIVTAGQSITLSIERAASADNQYDTGALTQDQVKALGVDSQIRITQLNGNGVSNGTYTASLAGALGVGMTYWLKGSVCTEVLTETRVTDFLGARWELRTYPGTNYVRVSNVLENGYSQYLGTVDYSVEIWQGRSSLERVYSKSLPSRTVNAGHYWGARWRKVFWIGEEPPETELHYDLTYLIGTGLIPPYDTGYDISTYPDEYRNPVNVASLYDEWQQTKHDILQTGLLADGMGMTGDRYEIGLLPYWTVVYLRTFDNRMKEVVLNGAEMAASFFSVHVRESDPTKSYFNRPVSIDDRPDLDYLRQFEGDVLPGLQFYASYDPHWEVYTDGDPYRHPSPDRAHQPSLAFVPYLVTGDYFYLEELMFWASFNLGYDPWLRGGATGLIPNAEIRQQAWAIRTIAQAAALMPDDFPAKAYYREKLINNIDKFTQMNVADRPDSIGIFACIECVEEPTPLSTPEPSYRYEYSPWMHDYLVLSLSYAISLGFTQAKDLRNQLAGFTVGRFRYAPGDAGYQGFPQLGGVGYYWPYQKLEGSAPPGTAGSHGESYYQGNGPIYYRNTEWDDYWYAITTANPNLEAALPNYGYMLDESNGYYVYAYIAYAALSSVVNQLDGAAKSFSFVTTALNQYQYPELRAEYFRNKDFLKWALDPNGWPPSGPISGPTEASSSGEGSNGCGSGSTSRSSAGALLVACGLALLRGVSKRHRTRRG